MSPDDVEDILQESYITAFTRLDTFREKSAFPRWLRKIVINTWRAFAKEKTNLYETSVQCLPEESPEETPVSLSVQDEVEISETNRALMALVDALPEPQRICVKLYYFEDMTVEEIAGILEVPAGTVMSRLYYGRRQLKDAIDQSGIHSAGALPASATTADPALLAKVIAALQAASESGAATAIASAGGGLALKLGAAIASLLAVGGLIGIPLLIPPTPSDPLPTVPTRATTTAATTTAATTAATTYATTSATTAATTAATTSTEPTSATTTGTTAPKPTVSFGYEECDGGIAITSYSGTESDVTIPASIDGKTVRAIASGAFRKNRALRSVVIPSSVKNIGSNAFRECSRLRSVTFGSGVNRIGDMAFLGCSALQKVSVPSNVREISIYAFAYCTALEKAVIAEGTEIIGYCAFCQCGKLRDVTLPASVTDIGGGTFDETAPELVITLPEGSYALDYAVENGLPYIIS